MDHSKLRPLDVLTSSHLKNEIRLAVINGVEGVHDVDSFLFYPLMKLGILQESATTSGFAIYSC